MTFFKSKSGQSNVMQFVLFFLVGIAIFTGIGNFFKFQSDSLRHEVSNYSVELMNGYISSWAIVSVNGCRSCDRVENKIEIEESTFGYFLEVSLDNINGISISTSPDLHEYNSSINNLQISISVLDGQTVSIEPINLTYDRDQNKLEIR